MGRTDRACLAPSIQKGRGKEEHPARDERDFDEGLDEVHIGLPMARAVWAMGSP